METSTNLFGMLFNSNTLVVLATLFAPLLAIQATRYLDRKREVGQNQQFLFRTLMATRATSTDIRHVEALNSIDVIFSNQKNKDEKNIRLAWKEYLDFLATRKYTAENADNWESERKNHQIELLSRMAKYLGYDFDKTHIKNQVYYPERFNTDENYATIGKESLLKVLQGKSPISINITGMDLPTQKDRKSVV